MQTIVTQITKQKGEVLRHVTFSVAVILIILAIAYPFISGDYKSDIDEDESYGSLPTVSRHFSDVTVEVPDFSKISDVNDRKTAFFAYLLPAIDAENEHILNIRQEVLRLHAQHQAGEPLTRTERRWVRALAEHYRVESDDLNAIFTTLKRRVDEVPDTLVLIQAANESGWGTSRFAQDARNFFGQWCWSEGCGIVPSSRPAGASHEVQYFSSIEASVQSYIRNLNTHFAYQELREIRADLRARNIPITAQPLTLGLMAYSERGEEYIVELNQMIRVNREIIRQARIQ